MPGTVIGISMNQGYPGTYSRNSDCIISNRLVRNLYVATDVGPSFGDPVILIGNGTSGDNNTVQSVADFVAAAGASGTFTASLFLGVAVREIKTFTSYTANMPTVGGYLPNQPCDVLERGSASVICRVGTPVAGGSVYIRIATGSAPAGYVIGGFEYRTDTDSSSCVLLSNSYWTTGLMDSNKVCELTIAVRNVIGYSGTGLSGYSGISGYSGKSGYSGYSGL